MKQSYKFMAWDKSEKRFLYSGIHDRNWYATEKNDAEGCHCVREKLPVDSSDLIIYQYVGQGDSQNKNIYSGHVVTIKGRLGEFKVI